MTKKEFVVRVLVELGPIYIVLLLFHYSKIGARTGIILLIMHGLIMYFMQKRGISNELKAPMIFKIGLATAYYAIFMQERINTDAWISIVNLIFIGVCYYFNVVTNKDR